MDPGWIQGLQASVAGSEVGAVGGGAAVVEAPGQDEEALLRIHLA